MEPKGCFMGVYIQPSLAYLVENVRKTDGISTSAYLRALIIADLMARDVLPKDLMGKILTGETLRQVRKIQVANATTAAS